MTEIWSIPNYVDSNGTNCRVVQGGCTDGTYLYVALNDGQSKSDTSISAIRKYEISTRKLVETYENLKISHCNDMSYLPKTNEILMIHNTPDREHVSIYDAETMTFKRMITLENLEIYSLSYDPYEECYWVGISNSYTFAKLDLDFNLVGNIIEGVSTGYTKQGMDVDSKYIYFLQFGTNCIMVYNKEGAFVKKLLLPKADQEPENICHIGDDFYVGYYKSSSGGSMYLVELGEGTNSTVKEPFLVTMTSKGSIPTYTDASGEAFTSAQGMCTDGTYLYVALNNSAQSKSVICKVDPETAAVIATYEGIAASLSNDLAYNSVTNEILVVFNGSAKKKVAIHDATTLAHKRTVDLPFEIFALSYNAADGYYYAGVTGTYDFARLDGSFREVGSRITGAIVGRTKQGIYTDGTYAFLTLSASNGLSVYRLSDGAYLGTRDLPVTANALQAMCKIGSTYYLVYTKSGGGATIYAATITIDE